jgi:hypothetical protein
MQIGSLVQTVGDFSETQSHWPEITFPKQGDILTIKDIEPHHAMKGVMLLHFEEFNHPSGICDKTKNKINFIEIQPPMVIDLKNIQLESNNQIRVVSILNIF